MWNFQISYVVDYDKITKINFVKIKFIILVAADNKMWPQGTLKTPYDIRMPYQPVQRSL